jgi:hypothetical protein
MKGGKYYLINKFGQMIGKEIYYEKGRRIKTW